MAKRKPKYIQEIKKQIAAEVRKKRTAFRKEKIKEALSKDKVETFDDICGIYYGLSRRAVELAAYDKIHRLAALGYSPLEIIKVMEPGGMTETNK
jgi:hypothetical protein